MTTSFLPFRRFYSFQKSLRSYCHPGHCAGRLRLSSAPCNGKGGLTYIASYTQYVGLTMATILVERFLAQWRGRSPQLPKAEVIHLFRSCQLTVAPWKQSHNSFIHPTVNIHAAALAGGWPMWQPLNVAVAMSYWPDASRRVSCQAAAAMQQTVATRTTVLFFGCGDYR